MSNQYLYDFCLEAKNIPCRVEYDGSAQKLDVYMDDNLFGSSPLVLPKEVNIEMPVEGVVRVYDETGMSLLKVPLLGIDSGDSVYLRPLILEGKPVIYRGNQAWLYLLGNERGLEVNPQNLVEVLMKYGPWNKEFDASESVLELPGSSDRYLFRGPNREGLLEATDGNGSVYVDPESLELSLGRSFNYMHVVSEIIEGSLAEGYIRVHETLPDYETDYCRTGNYVIREVRFIPNNTDPKKSCIIKSIKTKGIFE